MNSKNKKILTELKTNLFSLLGKELNEIILFGSHAHNKATKDSDVDILIILKKQYDWKKKRMIRDICYETGLKYGVLIDSKIISIYELNYSPKGMHPLYRDAIEKGIHA
jgi:predicted nucleotidyltransferase